MKRVNGYLDIEGHFKDLLKLDKIDTGILKKEKLIQEMFDGVNAMFWFNYNGERILFKCYNDDYNMYSELISEEFAKYLGLPCAHYDLATYNTYQGVISYNFKKNNYSYLYLGNILDYYIGRKELLEKENDDNTYKYFLKEFDDYAGQHDEIISNLEDIWNAIEFYLYDNSSFKKESIPSNLNKIFDQLTDYFIFQILSGNVDMHSRNIMVAIADDFSTIELAPLFDNENMYKLSSEDFLYNAKSPKLSLSRETIANKESPISILKEYLKVSDRHFIDKFEYLFSKLKDDSIYQFIENVENRTKIKIDDLTKRKIAEKYKDLYGQIQDILNDLYYKKK